MFYGNYFLFNIIHSWYNYCQFYFSYFFGVPYAPTHKSDLPNLFETINPSKEDIIVDIGSGDGVVLKVANNFNTKDIVFKINPFLVLISKIIFRRTAKLPNLS